MAGKVPVMDNAGRLVRLIDKSQVAADLSPNALWGAFAVDAERGFINQVYRVTQGAFDRFRYFGAKDWRKYGRSLHDVDKYVESQQPAFVIRAGDLQNSTLAGMSITSLATDGRFVSNGGYDFIDKRGGRLKTTTVEDNPETEDINESAEIVDLPLGMITRPVLLGGVDAKNNPSSIGMGFEVFTKDPRSDEFNPETDIAKDVPEETDVLYGFKLTDGQYFAIPQPALPSDPQYQNPNSYHFNPVNPENPVWKTDVPFNMENPLTEQAWNETTNNILLPVPNYAHVGIDPDTGVEVWMYVDFDDPMYRKKFLTDGNAELLTVAKVEVVYTDGDEWTAKNRDSGVPVSLALPQLNKVPNPYDTTFWKGTNNYTATLRTQVELDNNSNWVAKNPFNRVKTEPVQGFTSFDESLIPLNVANASRPHAGQEVILNKEYKWLQENYVKGVNLGFVDDRCRSTFLPERFFGPESGQASLLVFVKSEDSENKLELESPEGVLLRTAKETYQLSPTESETTRAIVAVKFGWSFIYANEIVNEQLFRQELTYSQLPDGYFDAQRWDGTKSDRVGRGQNEIGTEPNTFGSDLVICDFFAKGEGAWGNKVTVTISQRAWERTELPDGSYDLLGWDRFALSEKYEGTNIPIIERDADGRLISGPDGPRIFSLTVWDGANQAESYPNVSFNPRDVDGSGVSIYIENVLATSNYIGVVVNNTSEDIDLSNVWVLPRRIDLALVGSPGNPEGYVYDETRALVGGFASNGARFPTDVGATARSSRFQEALQKVFDNYIIYDAFLAFNAGQEITNQTFDMMIEDHGRCLGLTACSMGEAFLPGVPESTGGVTSKYVAKYNQWILSPDSDAGQDIYTSPVGWIGKIIGQNSIAGMLPYAPAGYRRGILQGALGLSRTWTAKERLDVVNYQWNPIKSDPTGFIVWDALTAQPIKSALSNIHVILSYQAMRRGIEQTLKGFEFEFNDVATVNTILNLLRGMADGYIAQNYAEQIVVDAQDNTYGTDQIRIRWNVRFKEVARTIVVDVIAYPSSQDISVSMAG